MRNLLVLLVLSVLLIAATTVSAQTEPTRPPDVPDYRWQGWLETMRLCDAGALPNPLCRDTQDMHYYLGIPDPADTPPPTDDGPPVEIEPVMSGEDILATSSDPVINYWAGWLPE